MITILKNNLIEIPKQLVEVKIHPDVSEKDEWFNYLHTHIKTGKMYYGYAFNHQLKSYWHTCEDEEFQKLFSDSKSEWKYEIVCSGGKREMLAKEKRYLTKNNAKKSDMYWNGNNGITSETTLDYSLVNTIIQNIKDEKYPIIVKTKKDVVGDTFKQVRGVEFVPGQVIMIKGEIDAARGSTENCEPLIYLEDYFHEGNDCGIGGNHTHKGFIKSKHGTEIDTQFIPKEDWSQLCEVGIRALGLGLNPKDKIERTPTNVEDAVNFCLNLHDSGQEWWTTDCKKYLKNTLNFKPHHLSQTKSKVEDELKKTDRKSINGMVFREYGKDSEYKHELDEMVKKNTSDDVHSVAYSSAQIDLERLIRGAGNKKTIVCIVHHPTPTAETKWKQTITGKDTDPYCEQSFLKIFDNWLGNDYKIVFKYMESWVTDTK